MTVVRAGSVNAAAALLGSNATRLLAGGTLVMRDVNAVAGQIDRLVLCDGLGLDRISIDAGHIELGSAVTMASVARHGALAFLKPVADSIGGPAVREMATVGGNLFAPYPYGDFAVALLALGGEVDVERADGRTTQDLERFLASGSGAQPQVVRSVRFAAPPKDSFRFVKVVRKHPHGASVLSIAAVVPFAAGRVSGARVAYGAMAETPIRARAVERALEGKALDAETVAAAVAVATEGCVPRSDPQASDWYRMKVLPVHLARLLGGRG